MSSLPRRRSMKTSAATTRRFEQYQPIEVTVSVGKSKVRVRVEVDLWGLTPGADPDALDREIRVRVLDKLKVQFAPGQRTLLREALKQFHNT